MEDIITVSYDESLIDKPCLCVMRGVGLTYDVLKVIHGEEAKALYKTLTDREGELKEGEAE